MVMDRHLDSGAEDFRDRTPAESRREPKNRKPFTPPRLRCHEKLPVITAGSLLESQWLAP